MKRLLTLAVALVASLTITLAQQLEEQLKSHIEYLTSDALAGRKAGSPEGHLAGDYIWQQFDQMHLYPSFQVFSETLYDGTFRNVIAKIQGIDSRKYIVVGAHYDHLGTKRGKIYHGADDNASGTAALLEVARSFTQRNYKPQHTIIFVAFDAEELGLYGSAKYAEQLPEGSVKAMINMDMIGWLKDGALNIEGTGTIDGCEEIIDRLAAKHNIPVAKKLFETSRLTATDTEAFALRGVPTLSLNTGTDSPYHKPEDTADKIDYEGVAKISRFVSDLVVEVDSNKQVASSGKVARKHRSSSAGFDVTLTYGAGRTRHHYPNVAIEGRGAKSWNIGLSAQYSLRYLALRASCIYDNRKALRPLDITNPYGTPATLGLKSVTVPAELMLKTKGKSHLYIGFGGYYSWNFEGSLDGEAVDMATLDLREHEWGWQWSLGARVSSFYIELTNRTALSPVYYNPVYADSAMPYNRTSLCAMGIYF